jgi:hypothetical protein
MKHNAVKRFTNNFPAFQMLSAIRRILIQRQIHMCLAAGGAPVTVKRSAVNRSTEVRTSLYIYIHTHFLVSSVTRINCTGYIVLKCRATGHYVKYCPNICLDWLRETTADLTRPQVRQHLSQDLNSFKITFSLTEWASRPDLWPTQPPIQGVPGSKAAGAWSWTLVSSWYWGQEYLDLYIHTFVRLHGIVLA